MPILSLLIVLLIQQSAPRQMSLGDVKQKATCAVAGVQGNVVVNCSAGVPRSTVALLNQQFAGRLKDKEARITELATEVNEWKDRFDKLTARLETPGVDERLRPKAEELLKAGQLDEVSVVLSTGDLLNKIDAQLIRPDVVSHHATWMQLKAMRDSLADQQKNLVAATTTDKVDDLTKQIEQITSLIGKILVDLP